ncbi:hypothetical protein [Anaerotignum sp. MB30-C6]|uniref:hypothetical protein n=1 Tax=Anaerotignum sp. MB30-C6 TaxID=3070814 RepID=UPI0027DBDC9D|nr:hypothetical protein [Anaerotignum sp. MB30-C6]WMI79812.1 hypothetical protein RBQ60_08115 [Anaerotignum sp. MB30-C6]
MGKKTWLIILCFVVMIPLFGCSKSDEDEQSSQEQVEELSEDKEAPQSQREESISNETEESVDVDLTKLSSTMVYSEVYNIIMVPDDYIGKTIKMKGFFRVYPSLETDAVYFAVVIPDATACCEQGFEFVLRGEHTYPEDYPTEDAEIEITGVLETYEEDGLEYFYVVADELVILE